MKDENKRGTNITENPGERKTQMNLFRFVSFDFISQSNRFDAFISSSSHITHITHIPNMVYFFTSRAQINFESIDKRIFEFYLGKTANQTACSMS